MICNFRLRPRVISQKSEGRYLVWINLFAERLLHFDPLQSHRFRAALLHRRTGGPHCLHLIRRIIMYLRWKWITHCLWKTKQKQKSWVLCQLKGYEPSFLCLEVLQRFVMWMSRRPVKVLCEGLLRNKFCILRWHPLSKFDQIQIKPQSLGSTTTTGRKIMLFFHD